LQNCLTIAVIWLFLLALAEAGCQGLLYYKYGPKRKDGEVASTYDPLVGWRNKPNVHLANWLGP
jgi:hypothetical protein